MISLRSSDQEFLRVGLELPQTDDKNSMSLPHVRRVHADIVTPMKMGDILLSDIKRRLFYIKMSNNRDLLERVMTVPVKTVDTTGTLQTAAESMVENNISALVVVEDNIPVGIVTERGVSKQIIRGHAILTKPVSQIMSKPLTVSKRDDDSGRIGKNAEHKIRRLP